MFFLIRKLILHHHLTLWYLIKGNIKKVDKTENPTEYRSPTTYVDYFQSQTIEHNGNQYGFELVFARPNRTYIEVLLYFIFTRRIILTNRFDRNT